MPTILIVDDRRLNREYLNAVLQHTGYRLLEATDGAEALERIRSERPDLVISDILMPTMDGYELLRQLRADPVCAKTPVIFYTAHYHEHEAQALARAWGVESVLSKGCEPDLILGTVAAALGLASTYAPPPSPADFDREHLRLVTDKLHDKVGELRMANERLTALVSLGMQLGSERDPERLVGSFCQAAREIVGARYALVGVVNGEGPLRFFTTSGMDAETAARLGVPAPRGVALDQVLDERRCLRLHNPGGDPAAIGFSPNHPPIHSLLVAPVVSPARVFGWLCLIDKIGADAFSDEDEKLAGILAAQVGRIYENGSLYADLLSHASELKREIAERQRIEGQLEETNTSMATLIQASPLAILVIDSERNVKVWNEAAERIFGWTAAEVLGRPVPSVPQDREEEFAGILRKQFAGEAIIGFATQRQRRDGSRVEVSLSAAPLRDRTGAVVGSVGVLADITDQKRLEDQFRQAQKMEAVGRLAGGVAHDFNNLLTVIIGYSEMLLSSLRDKDPLHDLADQIMKAGERAAKLTRQLLAFSRKQMLLAEVLDVNALILDMEKMLVRLIGEDIDFHVRPLPELGRVKADRSQIEQVVLNLVVNARDAMPRGGRLAIATANVDLDESFVHANPGARTGPYVKLTVTDTGCGMDEATRARIFEPFFTTKAPDKGTGLGLAMVYGVVKQSEGYVEVISEPGRGATFSIYLPRCWPEAPSSMVPPPVPHRAGQETILLVEDEDSIRRLGRLILQKEGYAVLEAAHGEAASFLCERHEGPIDLLVTDVVMPNMSGQQVAERLRAMRPGLKVLFLSGYTDEAIAFRGGLEPGMHFLQKPFTPDTLKRKVREVLDGRG